jgi:hypothetical protein
MNIARKNYATMEHNGKIKLTGNSIKSKKLPLYIEDFLDKGIKMLLEGDGQSFVEWYYEYLEKIYNKQIPLMKIAQRAKVKLSLDDYKKRSKEKTKSGNEMSRMAHIELAIRDKIAISLGDVIFYVNNGVKASHGDVQKVNKPKNGWKQEHIDTYYKNYEKVLTDDMNSFVQLNCYRLNQSELELNPNMLGEYNVARAVVTFNKRIEPLLIVFNEEIRNNLIVDKPEDRGMFTKEQCKLINGVPFEEGDQDKVEDVLTISPEELKFWNAINGDPNHIYNFAEEGWENIFNKNTTFTTTLGFRKFK